MKQQLEQFIANESALNGALLGISIRERNSGSIIYDRYGEMRMHPASNMKLLTAAAALTRLGKDYQFQTEIKTDGRRNGRKLEGNLYIVGKGDPTLLLEDIDHLANRLKLQGIEEIEGDIIGDDHWYDDIRLSPDMIWNDEHYYYGAPISALTVSPDADYDAGTIIIEVSPGNLIGEIPKIEVTPVTDYVTIINRATTDWIREEADELEVIRNHGTNDIIIKGNIPPNAPPMKERIAVWEPTDYALSVWKEALTSCGITWSGSVKRGSTPKQANVLISHPSPLLSTIIIPFMKLSNNGIGEVLIKELGRCVYGEGSWGKGLLVLNKTLEAYGMNRNKMVIRDGSGISHITLIPPHAITRLLYTIQTEAWFPHYLASLPVAGIKDRLVGGTLSDRMEGFSVQAKTGTIYGVSTLSGFAKTMGGMDIIFSIMINNLIDEEIGKDIEDRLLEIIIRN